jgi:hypothetical protein
MSQMFGQHSNRLRSIASEMVVDEGQHRHALRQQLNRLDVSINLVLSVDDDVV